MTTQSDQQIMQLINNGGIGTVVEFDGRCYKKTSNDVWQRFNQSTQKIKHQFPVLCQAEIINKCLDWINVTEWNHGIPSCNHPCSPSDYREGGKCDKMGCYDSRTIEDIQTDEGKGYFEEGINNF